MTDKFQRQNIGGLNRFNSNNYGFVHVSSVEGLDKFVNKKLTLSNSVSSNGASTDNAIVRYDGTTGQTIQNSGVVVDDNDEITGVSKLTSAELRTNNYKDNIGHSGFFLTPGANGVVQLTKDTYKGTQDALLSLHTDGTLQKSNIISSTVAIIDDSSTSTSSTWSSSKVSAEISAGGSSADFSGLTASSEKINTTNVTSQLLKGVTEKYTLSSSNCSVGQPLISNFTNGVITATPIGALPSQHKLIGIAGSNTTVGGTVEVLKDGFATARTTTTYQASSNSIALNSTTNNTTNSITNATTFTDSGVNNNYANSENYQITFDAGSGYTIDLVVNTSFAFEHTTNQMYDRLGFQTSSDGVTFTNASVSWLQQSANSSPPWSTSFAGGS